MKNNILRNYILKIISSPISYLSILATILVCHIHVFSASYVSPAFITIQTMLDLSAFRKIIVLFTSFPFAANFCSEWNSNSCYYNIIRTTKGKYIRANIIAVSVSSFFVVFIALSIYTLYLSVKYGFYENTDSSLGVYSDWGPKVFIFIKIFIYSLSAMSWVIFGYAISAIFPNPFVAICSPLILSYILELVTIKNDFLPNLWHLSLSHSNISTDPLVVFVYTTFVFLFLSFLYALLFSKIVERRIRNEFH